MNKDTNNHLNSEEDDVKDIEDEEEDEEDEEDNEEDNEKKKLKKSSARLCKQLIYIFEDEFPNAQHSYRKYGCEYLADIYKEMADRIKSLRNDLCPIIQKMKKLNMDTTLEDKTFHRIW